jgi:hypothetical protein
VLVENSLSCVGPGLGTYVEHYSILRSIVFHMVETDAYTYWRWGRNGRRVAIFVECDARLPVAAVAKSLSSVAAGDLFGPEGRHCAGERLLESLLEGKETILPVPSMDA